MIRVLSQTVTPAKAGVQGRAFGRRTWIPAFAGMTNDRSAASGNVTR
jgi:hypothetical protein